MKPPQPYASPIPACARGSCASAREPIALSPVQASDLQDLLAELLRTSGCLRTGEQPTGTELESEIADYRTNLESLAKVFPSVQGRLLAERARIQIEQSHIAARKAWAEASRRTL